MILSSPILQTFLTQPVSNFSFARSLTSVFLSLKSGFVGSGTTRATKEMLHWFKKWFWLPGPRGVRKCQFRDYPRKVWFLCAQGVHLEGEVHRKWAPTRQAGRCCCPVLKQTRANLPKTTQPNFSEFQQRANRPLLTTGLSVENLHILMGRARRIDIAEGRTPELHFAKPTKEPWLTQRLKKCLVPMTGQREDLASCRTGLWSPEIWAPGKDGRLHKHSVAIRIWNQSVPQILLDQAVISVNMFFLLRTAVWDLRACEDAPQGCSCFIAPTEG